MGRPVTISRSLLERVLADARRDPVRERCGLLLGRGNDVLDFIPAANVHPHPERHFELDPAVLIAAHRAERAGALAVVGHYHSHPTGYAAPSARDAAAAADDAMLWLIVTSESFALWRSLAGGAVHGRFERVDLLHLD